MAGVWAACRSQERPGHYQHATRSESRPHLTGEETARQTCTIRSHLQAMTKDPMTNDTVPHDEGNGEWRKTLTGESTSAGCQLDCGFVDRLSSWGTVSFDMGCFMEAIGSVVAHLTPQRLWFFRFRDTFIPRWASLKTRHPLFLGRLDRRISNKECSRGKGQKVTRF